MPLPDGLHFTPAMSARAILSDELRIVEVPMEYREREGRSKLSVVRDGLRFLRVIVQSALLYRPSRPLALAGAGCIAAAFLWMIYPIVYYAANRSLLEWMIYRFVVSNLLGTTGVLLLCSSYLSRRIVGMTLRQSRESLFFRLARGFFTSALFWITVFALLAVGAGLVAPAFIELLGTRHIFEHWSRFVAMSFFVQVAAILMVTRIFDYILELIASQLEFLQGSLAG
jgi:hypothetical protein